LIAGSFLPYPSNGPSKPAHLIVLNTFFLNFQSYRSDGKLIAIGFDMVKVTIRMNALPEKLKELKQALVALVGSIRKTQGCRGCYFCCSVADENELCLFEEWEGLEVLSNHLKSDIFKVLLGAKSLLRTPHEVKVYKEMGPASDASTTRSGDLPGRLVLQS
jgi:quinol monooxygenase YgiN